MIWCSSPPTSVRWVALHRKFAWRLEHGNCVESMHRSTAVKCMVIITTLMSEAFTSPPDVVAIFACGGSTGGATTSGSIVPRSWKSPETQARAQTAPPGPLCHYPLWPGRPLLSIPTAIKSKSCGTSACYKNPPRLPGSCSWRAVIARHGRCGELRARR